MTDFRLGWGLGTASILSLIATGAAAQAADPIEAITQGKLLLDVRTRYEAVDQAGFTDKAEALTLRTRLGWETASFKGFKGLIEFEDVRDLSGGDYSDGVPPAEPFPVIADPEVTELNRFQVSWTASPAFTATVGRQRIMFDDQRFIGSVGWRQDEQTFDAVKADFAAGGLKVSAAYLDQANRVFAEALDFQSEAWLFNAAFPVSPLFSPVAFVYALDFDNSPANSSLTSGIRVSGAAKPGGLGLAWTGSYARQADYGGNPGDFELSFWQADLAASYGPITVKAAHETLEGDGVRGFATPLATLHAFQGWADVFLTTPASGIEDNNLTLTWRTPIKAEFVSNVVLMARYHDFQSELTGADLGSEWNAQATAQITPRLAAIAKYADYEGAPGFAGRTKLWFGLEFRL